MREFIATMATMGLGQIIVLGGFLLGGYYFLLYDNGDSQRDQIQDIQQKTQGVERDIQKKKEELQRSLSFQRDLKREARSIEHFLNYVPNEQTAVDIFHFMTAEAKTSGVNIKDKQDQGVVNMEAYDALKVQLKVGGSFSQVLLFLSRLTAQKRILVVDNISMSLSSKADQWITAEMIVYAYRYKGDKKQEEGAKDG